jgi:hypothetical protein
VDFDTMNYVFGQSRFLLTSLEPVVSQVITASKDAPSLVFFLKPLDWSGHVTMRTISDAQWGHLGM